MHHFAFNAFHTLLVMAVGRVAGEKNARRAGARRATYGRAPRGAVVRGAALRLP